MRIIGLVRHFKVVQSKPQKPWMTSDEFDRWIILYDQCEIYKDRLDLSEYNWDLCFSSDLSRAIETAKTIYLKDIIHTDSLREITIRSVFRTQLKLHYNIWTLLGRIAWLVSHRSQIEGKQETLKRIRKFVEQLEILEKPNLLIVSHGALMFYLRKELIKRGYKGKSFIKAKNGMLYTYERLL
ncbi:broad specificity phosphatase PhoE [Paenibacillus wynnii]|nr:broad specificity phosphatase PhoE [Paenibacillus wynnii]